MPKRKSKMRELKFILIALFLTAGLFFPAFGQNPWQQDKGEFLISPYLSRYQATSYRDRSGEKIQFDNDGKFQNFNPRLYLSMPIKGYKINLFASLPLLFNSYTEGDQKQQNTDLGDIELGLRFHLANLEDHFLMASVTTFIPAYSNNQLPFAGYGRFGFEGRLIMAGNSPWMGEYNNFHKIELGYRYFFPSDPGQVRFFLSHGIRFMDNIVLLGEVDGLFSFSNDSDFFENNLQLVSDFTMVKASINLGYEFNPAFSIYGGIFHDILNRNSGIGSGFQIFSVFRLKNP